MPITSMQSYALQLFASNVSIRQHTSAYVSIRQPITSEQSYAFELGGRGLAVSVVAAYVSIRMLTYADVCL